MKRHRALSLLICLASIAIVGAALLSQMVGGLQPCELCLYERWPYYAAIPLTLLAALSGAPRFRAMMLMLAALAFAASTALAFYHVGVEQHWFAGPTACTGLVSNAGSVAALQQMLEARQPVSCDVVQWSFMGLSLASFNLIASIALLAVSVQALRRGRGR